MTEGMENITFTPGNEFNIQLSAPLTPTSVDFYLADDKGSLKHALSIKVEDDQLFIETPEVEPTKAANQFFDYLKPVVDEYIERRLKEAGVGQ